MLKQKGVKNQEGLNGQELTKHLKGRKDVTPQELVEYLEDNTN